MPVAEAAKFSDAHKAYPMLTHTYYRKRILSLIKPK